MGADHSDEQRTLETGQLGTQSPHKDGERPMGTESPSPLAWEWSLVTEEGHGQERLTKMGCTSHRWGEDQGEWEKVTEMGGGRPTDTREPTKTGRWTQEAH